MTSSREGLESCSDSHVHCANGYENKIDRRCDRADRADRADDRWSADIHVGDNDDLDP